MHCNCKVSLEWAFANCLLGSPENSGPENIPPVGVFWDIENCSVPSGRSAGAVVQRIRSRFFQGHREAEFICVCDISKESKAVIQELNNCQVSTIMYFVFIVMLLEVISAIPHPEWIVICHWATVLRWAELVLCDKNRCTFTSKLRQIFLEQT